MREFTKHDVSAELVKLDYDALYKMACFAYTELRDKVSSELSALRELEVPRENKKVSTTGRYMISQRLAESARRLAIITETLSALDDGFSRYKVEIINREKKGE